MLTPQERDLTKRLFAGGPAVFVEEGYSDEEAAIFLQRVDVQAEWALLTREHSNQEILFGHAKFVAKRDLSRLLPGASAVLAQALAGPQYLRDTETGAVQIDSSGRPILLEPEISGVQLSAAKDILERMEVTPRARDDAGGKLNIKVLFDWSRTDQVDFKVDPKLKSKEERALSRERVRNMIEQLRPRLETMKAESDAVLEGDAYPASRAPGKARPTKRATQKKSKKKTKKKSKKKTNTSKSKKRSKRPTKKRTTASK